MKKNIFSKKHYKAIADILHNAEPLKSASGTNKNYYDRKRFFVLLVEKFITLFKNDNINFDTDLFWNRVRIGEE